MSFDAHGGPWMIVLKDACVCSHMDKSSVVCALSHKLQSVRLFPTVLIHHLTRDTHLSLSLCLLDTSVLQSTETDILESL